MIRDEALDRDLPGQRLKLEVIPIASEIKGPAHNFAEGHGCRASTRSIGIVVEHNDGSRAVDRRHKGEILNISEGVDSFVTAIHRVAGVDDQITNDDFPVLIGRPKKRSWRPTENEGINSTSTVHTVVSRGTDKDIAIG